MQETLSTEQEAAIIRFARDNGRTWKQALGAAWMDGSDANESDGGYLRQVRNQFGPSWLFKYKLPVKPQVTGINEIPPQAISISRVQRLLTQIVAKHDAARARADKLMTCQSTQAEAMEMSYRRGQQNAFNEVACMLKGVIRAEEEAQ